MTLPAPDDELAFYDALEINDSAVAVLGDETLKMIARELVATVRLRPPGSFIRLPPTFELVSKYWR